MEFDDESDHNKCGAQEMKRLHDEDNFAKPELLELEAEVFPYFKDLLLKWTLKGYCFRDVSAVIMRSALEAECRHALATKAERIKARTRRLDAAVAAEKEKTDE